MRRACSGGRIAEKGCRQGDTAVCGFRTLQSLGHEPGRVGQRAEGWAVIKEEMTVASRGGCGGDGGCGGWRV